MGQRGRVVCGVSRGIQCCAGFLGAVVQTKVTPHYRTEVRVPLCTSAPLGLSLNIAFLNIARQVATMRAGVL